MIVNEIVGLRSSVRAFQQLMTTENPRIPPGPCRLTQSWPGETLRQFLGMFNHGRSCWLDHLHTASCVNPSQQYGLLLFAVAVVESSMAFTSEVLQRLVPRQQKTE